MRFTFDNVTYYKCSSCSSGVNCNICRRDLTSEMTKAGMQDVQLDLKKNRTLSLESPDADRDDVIDLLENLGIFC
ncbi:MAG: hypothetical protein IJX90_09905 [Blautia sp.]|nr:hypothetical protein [Blautia sp.]